MHSLWEALERQTMKLRGKKALLRLFKQHNVELVMHGHLHRSSEYTREGIRFLNAGGSVLDTDENTLPVNVITISDGKVETEIHSLSTIPSAKPAFVSGAHPLTLSPHIAA